MDIIYSKSLHRMGHQQNRYDNQKIELSIDIFLSFLLPSNKQEPAAILQLN